MTLNGAMAVTLRYFTEFGKPARCRKRSVAELMHESVVFLVRVQCRRKESSRSLSHLLMNFLLLVCYMPKIIKVMVTTIWHVSCYHLYSLRDLVCRK